VKNSTLRVILLAFIRINKKFRRVIIYQEKLDESSWKWIRSFPGFLGPMCQFY